MFRSPRPRTWRSRAGRSPRPIVWLRGPKVVRVGGRSAWDLPSPAEVGRVVGAVAHYCWTPTPLRGYLPAAICYLVRSTGFSRGRVRCNMVRSTAGGVTLCERFFTLESTGGSQLVSPTRVVVAEDDVLLREGLASLLDRSGFAVVGQAGDGEQLLALVREHTPELVVTDIRMPPNHATEGLDTARIIRDEFPDIAILVLSAHVDVEHAMELLASGHSIGYLLKSRVTDVTDFIDTLERIAKGASVVDPALVSELVSARRRSDPLAVLSDREREVLALMAEGRSNAGIAHQIWVTEGTVEKHVRSILTKLDIPVATDDHRRVLAVITYLETR